MNKLHHLRMYEFHVTFPALLDVRASLELFRRSGHDLVDRWDGQRLVRAVPIAGTWVPFMAVPDGTLAAPSMRVAVDFPEHVAAIRQVAERSFIPRHQTTPSCSQETPSWLDSTADSRASARFASWTSSQR